MAACPKVDLDGLTSGISRNRMGTKPGRVALKKILNSHLSLLAFGVGVGAAADQLDQLTLNSILP